MLPKRSLPGCTLVCALHECSKIRTGLQALRDRSPPRLDPQSSNLQTSPSSRRIGSPQLVEQFLLAPSTTRSWSWNHCKNYKCVFPDKYDQQQLRILLRSWLVTGRGELQRAPLAEKRFGTLEQQLKREAF